MEIKKSFLIQVAINCTLSIIDGPRTSIITIHRCINQYTLVMWYIQSRQQLISDINCNLNPNHILAYRQTNIPNYDE